MNTLKKIQDGLTVGNIFTLKRFTKLVKDGCFTSYDGYGEYHDGEKATGVPVKLTLSALRSAANTAEYPYVIWYNR